jgi:CRP-like cAMP-binding protein
VSNDNGNTATLFGFTVRQDTNPLTPDTVNLDNSYLARMMRGYSLKPIVQPISATGTFVSKEPIWYLKSFNLFHGMSEDEMEKLSDMIKTDHIKRLDSVYLQGDPAHWIYFLKEGIIRLDMINEAGKLVTITLLKPGEIFGELSLEEHSNAATEAVALEDSYLCRMSRERFWDMLRMHQDMIFSVNKILGLRMRKIQMAVQDLIFLDVPGRIAKLLHGLVETDAEKVPQGFRIKIRLTHQELANLVGATREMVSIVIGRMVDEGLISQDKRHFIIRDMSKLTKLFNRR